MSGEMPSADVVDTVETSGEVLFDLTVPEEETTDWLAYETADFELLIDPGGFGYPCESDSQCDSGFCVVTPDGEVCTVPCTEECPEGWTCALHMPSLPDQIFICAPAHANLCKPCYTNSDCQTNGVDAGDTCIPYGSQGNFCGGKCLTTDECLSGYHCAPLTDTSGATSSQCVKDDGLCECAAWFVDEGAGTGCYVENQWGECYGERHCSAAGLTECEAPVPQQEECNGLDDDCDEEIDEGTQGAPCFESNEWGVCTGSFSCDDGTLNCSAQLPEPESCDGLDNNCNGQTDEEYPDTDGDGIKDCMETDKDGDGVLDAEDNCPGVQNQGQEDFDLDTVGDLCDPDDDNDLVGDDDDCQAYDPSVYPGANEVCNGKDDNCNVVIDEGFSDNDLDGIADCADIDDDNDGHPDELDCLPLDPASFPGAEEKCDDKDNDCDELIDEDFPDTDNDGKADCLDQDMDNDGIPNEVDNCPSIENEGQEDLDQDGQGDSCDADLDGDGIPNSLDNCSLLFNPQQVDLDEDGTGDSCDDDLDGDTVENKDDNCPETPNPGQENNDGDSEGDICDDDLDGDGTANSADNCVGVANPDQLDTDGDGIGDACEKDLDGDGIPDLTDNCVGEENPGQEDCDGDGVGDACQDDDDGDGVLEPPDNCLCLPNPGQEDADQDGIGDPCDTDADGDGIANGLDNCPAVFNPGQADLDGDLIGDACEDDVDGDGIPDQEDNCPLAGNGGQEDLDDDGMGDVCDDDTDGDGDPDETDCAPFDPEIGANADEDCDGSDNNCDGIVDEGFDDNDLDGWKDCVDPDDDNDGDPDATDCAPYNPAVNAGAAEECNGVDDDCNGAVDEGVGLLACGKGECFHVIEACQDGELQFCNPFEGAAPETCDGLDNDCDEEVDEDMGTSSCGLGPCAHTVDNCVDGIPQVCDPLEGSLPEECDGLDNDCDALIDDDLGSVTCGLGECEHTVDNCVGGIPQVCNAEEGVGVEKCDGLDNDCDGEWDEELGTTTCGVGPCQHTVDNCFGGVPQVCDPLEGAELEICGDGVDNDCSGVVDNGCTFAGCGELHELDPGAASGIHEVDPDGQGGEAPFDVWCEMDKDEGGWTLVAVVANDGSRHWNTVAVFQNNSTMGSLNSLTNDFKSPAYRDVEGSDLLIVTDEYEFAFHDLLSDKSFGKFVSDNWPGGCSTSWMHGMPDYYANLTAEQAALFGFTLRGHDDNASCFPDSNENAAISFMAAECCWVNGLGNNTCCNGTWGSHDHSLLKKSRLIPITCGQGGYGAPGVWPCNPQNVTLNSYTGGDVECYDTSCKVGWVRVYVR